MRFLIEDPVTFLRKLNALIIIDLRYNICEKNFLVEDGRQYMQIPTKNLQGLEMPIWRKLIQMCANYFVLCVFVTTYKKMPQRIF